MRQMWLKHNDSYLFTAGWRCRAVWIQWGKGVSEHVGVLGQLLLQFLQAAVHFPEVAQMAITAWYVIQVKSGLNSCKQILQVLWSPFIFWVRPSIAQIWRAILTLSLPYVSSISVMYSISILRCPFLVASLFLTLTWGTLPHLTGSKTRCLCPHYKSAN